MSLLDRLNKKTEEKSASGVQPLAYAYVRVSHEDSAERGTSIATQKREIQQFAAKNGYTIEKWFEEPGKSAYKNAEKRVVFRQMIEDAKQNSSITSIIIWKSDRFSRNRYEATSVKHELIKAGVSVLSVMEPYDPTTVAGVVMESVTDAMNQVRSMELGQQIHKYLATNAQDRDRQTGWAYKNGGRALWGYKLHRVFQDADKKYSRQSHCIWLLDDSKAMGKPVWEWTRTMLLDWRLKQRLGYDTIAAKLTEEGVPNPSGGYGWNHSTIYYLLRWDRLLTYAGYGIWNRKDYRNGGGGELRHPSEWVTIEGAHPAIISLEEANALGSLQKSGNGKKSSSKKERSRWNLSGGQMICAQCGSNYTSTTQKDVDYYVCGSYQYRAGVGCKSAWRIPRVELEHLLVAAICRHIPKGITSLERMKSKINKYLRQERDIWSATEKERLRTISRLDKEINRLVMSLSRGIAPEKIEEEIALRTKQKSSLQLIQSAGIPADITIDQLVELSEGVWSMAESDSQEIRQQLIGEWISELVVDSEKKEIEILFTDGDLSSFTRVSDGSASKTDDFTEPSSSLPREKSGSANAIPPIHGKAFVIVYKKRKLRLRTYSS